MPSIELLFVLGAVVNIPLALRLVRSLREAPRALDIALRVHPFAAAAAVVAIVLAPGPLPAAFAAVWAAFTLLVFAAGVTRFIRRRTLDPVELAIDAGLAYLVVGGAWLVIWRAGLRPLDLSSTIVALTAIHFHYAGCVSPILVGLLGRELRPRGTLPRAYVAAVAGIIAGPALVAAGFAGLPQISAPAVLVLAAGTFVAAVVLLRFTASAPLPASARMLLGLSGLSVLVPTALAAIYSVSLALGSPRLSIDDMVVWHGWPNALGYAFCGLLGWTVVLRTSPSRSLEPSIRQ
jgi:hypothetical protein